MYTTMVKINTIVFIRWCLFLFNFLNDKHFLFYTTPTCLFKSWLSSSSFLVVEFEVEIGRIELVQSDVTIFTTASVSLAIWVEGQRVDGTEMALDSTEFFFEHQVEETCVEFTYTSGRRRYVHGVLTTSEHHLHNEYLERNFTKESEREQKTYVIHNGRDGSAVYGTFSFVRFQTF